MKTCGIYKIVNSVNGKVYVGQSVRCEYRITHHRKLLRGNKHPNQHLQSAWLKYGEKSFLFEITKQAEKHELDKEERQSIAQYKNEFGVYNLESGGHKLKEHSQETKDKISNSLKGRSKSKQTRDRMSLGQKGRVHSEETKAKLKLNHKGYTGKSPSLATRNKISKKLTGHKVSMDTRDKISKSTRMLNDCDVTRIKELRQLGYTYTDIGKIFGVHGVTISKYANR